MTPLSLDAPLASLLAACEAAGRKLSQRDLGEARQPPVAQASVAHAVEAGDRIKLSTLAAYAAAAGYTLWLIANGLPGWALRLLVDEHHTMSMEEARALIEGWGLAMVLGVEPGEGSEGR